MTQKCPKLFVLGSCVSRDLWLVDGAEQEISLAGYIARTSLASAFGTVAAPPGVSNAAVGIKSNFQRRMVLTDLDKQASRVILASDFDYLLLDLIDERFDLVNFPKWSAQTFYTLSAELRRAYRVPRANRIRSGTDAHFSAWQSGLHQLFHVVPPDRVILNRAYWARTTVNGVRLDDSWAVDEHNSYLHMLYDEVRRSGSVRAVDCPDVARANPAHRWGLAPYHYEDAVYHHVRKQIVDVFRSDQLEEGVR